MHDSNAGRAGRQRMPWVLGWGVLLLVFNGIAGATVKMLDRKSVV